MVSVLKPGASPVLGGVNFFGCLSNGHILFTRLIPDFGADQADFGFVSLFFLLMVINLTGVRLYIPDK